jgi:hypothetical protein
VEVGFGYLWYHSVSAPIVIVVAVAVAVAVAVSGPSEVGEDGGKKGLAIIAVVAGFPAKSPITSLAPLHPSTINSLAVILP